MASPLDNGSGNGKRSSTPATPAIHTPYGPDRTLYPSSLFSDPYPELLLLSTILNRARRDAEWLNALESRPRSDWTLHERRRHTRMLADDIWDPRDWLNT